MPFRRGEWPMHRLVRKIQQKRFGPGLLYELHREIGQKVSDVAFVLRFFAVDVQRRININALSLEANPIIETRPWVRIIPHMNLAHVRRFITGLLHGDGGEVQLEAGFVVIAVSGDPVRMNIAPGQKTRSGRRAERRCDERVLQVRAFLGNAVYVGSLHPRMTQAR